MIKSYRDEETRLVWRREPSRRLQSVARVALRKLLAIDAAISLEKLRSPPGNRLERLRGDREGQYSVRGNDQFRICFVWKEDEAHDVEITDYH